MKRSILASTAALSLCLIAAFSTSACLQGAPLENEEAIKAARGCDMVALFQSCDGIACHESSADYPVPLGGVDFFSPGFPENLISLDAVYPAPANNTGMCPTTPELIIDPANPLQSLLIRKLRNQQTCGDAMPSEPRTLTEEEKQCFEEWVVELVDAQSSGSTAQ